MSDNLDAPGKGLPVAEAFIARYVYFPLSSALTSQNKAVKTLTDAGKACLRLSAALSDGEINKRVLIPRFTGIEDNSRNWSVLMCLEHLLITGKSMLDITQTLARNIAPGTVVRIENVKPNDELDRSKIIDDYDAFIRTYAEQIRGIDNIPRTGITHHHPWFGNITAHQWLCLNGGHHKIHLRQVHNIIARL